MTVHLQVVLILGDIFSLRKAANDHKQLLYEQKPLSVRNIDAMKGFIAYFTEVILATVLMYVLDNYIALASFAHLFFFDENNLVALLRPLQFFNYIFINSMKGHVKKTV